MIFNLYKNKIIIFIYHLNYFYIININIKFRNFNLFSIGIIILRIIQNINENKLFFFFKKN